MKDNMLAMKNENDKPAQRLHAATLWGAKMQKMHCISINYYFLYSLLILFR